MTTTGRLLQSLAHADDNDGFEAGSGKTIVGVVRHLMGKCPEDAELLAYDLSDENVIIGIQVRLPSGQERWIHGNSRRAASGTVTTTTAD